jgi:hypothetical protein
MASLQRCDCPGVLATSVLAALYLLTLFAAYRVLESLIARHLSTRQAQRTARLAALVSAPGPAASETEPRGESSRRGSEASVPEVPESPASGTPRDALTTERAIARPSRDQVEALVRGVSGSVANSVANSVATAMMNLATHSPGRPTADGVLAVAIESSDSALTPSERRRRVRAAHKRAEAAQTETREVACFGDDAPDVSEVRPGTDGTET